MNVSRDDLHALDQKINDHKLEVYKTMTEVIASPLNKLTQEIREMTGEFRGVKESTGRFSKELKESQDKIVKLSERLILVEAKQGTIIGITGKVFPYFVAFVIALIPALLGANLWINKTV
jgi:chromosome segregation ATPase